MLMGDGLSQDRSSWRFCNSKLSFEKLLILRCAVNVVADASAPRTAIIHLLRLHYFLFLHFYYSSFFLTGVSISASLVCSLCSSIRLLLPIGNTVIHLDKALARIREYERMKLKADFNPFHAAATASSSDASNAPPPPPNLAGAEGTRPDPGCQDVYHCATVHRRTAPLKCRSVPTRLFFCVCPSAEGASASDLRCPQINTQQLDRQIKAIMTEVIPFLKVPCQ